MIKILVNLINLDKPNAKYLAPICPILDQNSYISNLISFDIILDQNSYMSNFGIKIIIKNLDQILLIFGIKI